MRQGIRFAAVCAALFAAIAPSAALSAPQTTEVQTIRDVDGDDRLETASGDPHITRQELGAKAPALGDPVPLLFFGQLTDKHVIDEESPLRVEFTDKFGTIFTSAYRPHEGLTPQVIESMVKQVANTTSPVNRRPLELVMTTGDNTDNSQCNETRWMIDLLDGHTDVDPDSGVPAGTQFTARQVCQDESAPPPAPAPECATSATGRYEGVRGRNEYYEPDSSREPGANVEDGPGYSPDRSENEREAGRSSTVRDFPGLFEAMNDPFWATGLDIPWYGIFGNHDGLIQGNQPRNPIFEALAVSCIKVTGLAPAGANAVINSTDKAGAMADVLAGMGEVAQGDDESLFMNISADPRRRPLRKSEYIEEHFHTGGTPVGHGFTRGADMGNYSFHPKPGLRFIVLDTIAEHGLEEGNLDHEQFVWLHQELVQADGAQELAVIFAHHSLRTMGQPPVSPFLPGDTGGNLTPLVHFGEGLRNSGRKLPCLVTTPGAPPYPTETLRCLLLRHKSVIAFINGHEHANRVTPYERATGTGPVQGGFWEINTASHIDWPQQSRVIDIVDNPDKTISIWATLVDHAAAADPGGAPAPRPGQGNAGEAVGRLASIARELSFNDPHATNDDGNPDPIGARGTPKDRNVELVVRDPR